MNSAIRITFLAFLIGLLNVIAPQVEAQSTAFAYQGRLSAAGQPANGSYEFHFSLFDDGTNGVQQGPTLTNTVTAVTNGLFTVMLDFGNQFTGGDRWLEITVCTNGGRDFVTLNPRQKLAPIPYAITAMSVLPGGIPAGVYTNAIIFSNAGNQFFGSGSGITNLSFNNLAADSRAYITNIANGTAAAALAAADAFASTNTLSLTQLPSGVITNGYFRERWRFNCYGFSSGGDPRLDWGYGQNGLWLFSSTTFTNNYALASFTPIYQDPNTNFMRDAYVVKVTDAAGNLHYLLSYTTHQTVDDMCSPSPGPGVAISDDGVHFTFLGNVILPNGAATNCYAKWSPKFHLNGRLATVGLGPSSSCTYPTNAVMYDVDPNNYLNWSNPRPITGMYEQSSGVMIYTNGLYYYFTSAGTEYNNTQLVSTNWHLVHIDYTGDAGPSVFYFQGLWYWFTTDLGTRYRTSIDLTNWSGVIDCGFASQEGSVMPEQYAINEPVMFALTNSLAAMGDTNLVGTSSNGVQVAVSLASLMQPITSNRIVSVNGSQVMGAVPLAAGVTGRLGIANLPANVLTNNQTGVALAGTFAGDGSALASLNAGALAGTVPLGSLPGISTNISNGGITFYITNGLIMRISIP